jgi:hypothetical protein
MKNNLAIGDTEGARRAGEDAGLIVAALHTAVFGGGQPARRARRSESPAGSGHVRVRKALDTGPRHESVEIVPGYHVHKSLCERDENGKWQLRRGVELTRMRRD